MSWTPVSLLQGPYLVHREEKTHSLFSVWLQKTAAMANKNTAQGTQMATHTAAAIVVWNVSHTGAQEKRGWFNWWYNSEIERQRSDWGEAEDVMIYHLSRLVLTLSSATPHISNYMIQQQQSKNFICIIVQQHILNLTALAMSIHLGFDQGLGQLWGGNSWYLTIFKQKMHCLVCSWFGIFWACLHFSPVCFWTGETGKESQCCGSFFRPYSLDHTKSPFWGRHFMCSVAHSTGEKDLPCLCLFRVFWMIFMLLLVESRDLLYCSSEMLSGRPLWQQLHFTCILHG